MERAVFWSTLGLAMLVFLGSIGFFFVFPRVGIGFFMQQDRGGIAASGFGDTVELGGHGTIREDRTVVMRVRFPESNLDHTTAYFRGLSLDHYTGRRWIDEDDRQANVVRDQEGNGYLINARQGSTWLGATAGTLVADIYLEPIQSDVLFAPGRFVAFGLPDDITDLPDSWFDRAVRADQSGEVRLSQRSAQGVAYRVYADTSRPPNDELANALYSMGQRYVRDDAVDVYNALIATRGEDTRAPDFSDGFYRSLRANNADYEPLIENYLQLAEGQITPQMQDLVDRIDARTEDNYAFARDLQAYLRDMEYTTDLPAPSSNTANVLDEFLFDWGRGHCEYFATAMVILMRAQGIPARIVNGFVGADYNDVGEYYAVRQANAHSWVEVFFPGPGWVRFDPTPGGMPEINTSGALWKLQMWIDNMRLTWFRWVIEYDLEKQVSVIRDVVENNSGEESGAQLQFIQRLSDLVAEAARWMWYHAKTLVLILLVWIGMGLTLQRRARSRIPWGATDNALLALWWVLVLAITLFTWPDGPFSASALGLIYAPLAGACVYAYQSRLGLFDSGRQASRSSGSSFVSVLYARLLRITERELGILPRSLTARELRDELDLQNPDAAAALDEFLKFYEAARFAGGDIEADEQRRWRGQFKQMRKLVVRDLREQDGV
jgi:transglutaminase-like putative cysteine protease